MLMSAVITLRSVTLMLTVRIPMDHTVVPANLDLPEKETHAPVRLNDSSTNSVELSTHVPL